MGFYVLNFLCAVAIIVATYLVLSGIVPVLHHVAR